MVFMSSDFIKEIDNALSSDISDNVKNIKSGQSKIMNELKNIKNIHDKESSIILE